MKVLVLHGGDSPEREVSFRSAKSVIHGLEAIGVAYQTYDPLNGLDGLKQACKGCDIVLPILHGKNGEDGVVQDALDDIGIRYLGADGKVSRITIDKVKTHEVLEANGIKMPRYEVVTKDSFSKSILSSKPYVLKPIFGGSSIDTVIVRQITNEKTKLSLDKLDNYQSMLLEELIDGIEISAPVLDQTALPVIYIQPPEGGEFDYLNKYNGKSLEICPAPVDKVSEKIQKEIQSIVENAHKILSVRHLSRSEFIVDSNNQIYMLELNTIPGLTDASLFPKGASAVGINMNDLVDKFVKMVTEE
jgi:D-alanine-D-alanine ligase